MTHSAGEGRLPHVVFDARMLNASGIGSHIRGLVEGMYHLRARGPRCRFTFLGDPSALGSRPCFAHFGTIRPFKAPIYGIREQLLFPDIACDGIHFPHYNVPRRPRRAFIVTVHDLIHLLFPADVGSRLKWLAGREMVGRAVDDARLILTVSESTRRDLVQHLGVDPGRIVVTPNAVSGSFNAVSPADLERVRSAMGLPGRYILAVGIAKPHKNQPFLIEAFARWERRSASGLRLVICGLRAGEEARLARFAAEKDAAEFVRFAPHMDHAHMPAVYQGAEALVFPSLYEGFGLPVIEAQKLGVPVLASTAASIPEVAGDGALFFDPRSERELCARLDELFGKPGLRERLVDAGRRNEKRFRWEDSSRRTLQAYHEAFG
jgi:alpha-1,3-rhamnosyl/mannosyltransferase